MARLRFEHDPPFDVRLAGTPLTLGRSRENDIQLNHPSISRRHAVIEPRGLEYWVVDCGSMNGIAVNGRAVKQGLLPAGARVEFGKVVARFDISDESTVALEGEDRLMQVGNLFKGRYQVGELLGEGSQADVFKAHRESDGRAVALKVFRGKAVVGSEAAIRFANEARTLCRLTHPAIVAILDVGSLDGTPFFALDYLPRGSLEVLLRREGTLPVDRAVLVAIDVAAALGHAHEQNVVHRDVKPANVMMDASDRAVVADFGIAKLLDETGISVSGAFCGTPRYMSPEQFAGKRATPASDVYSLGAMLYRCLTGRVPVDGETIGQIAARMKDPDASFPSVEAFRDDLDPALVSAVHACLDRDPRRRPSAGELERTLIDDCLT